VSWVAVTFGLLALLVILGLAITVTVLVSQALTDAFRTLDHMHERSQKNLDKVLDRLMTIRWEDYVATQAMSEEEEGGFFTPEEQREEQPGMVEVEEPGLWGHLSGLRSRAEVDEEETQILREDFGGRE
jgi:hypothetical protein